MSAWSRRQFIQISASAGAHQLFASPGAGRPGKDIRLGLFVSAGNDPEGSIAKVHDLGLPTCQVSVEEFRPEIAARLRKALDRYHVEATALSSGGGGRMVWNFYEGPMTIGLVPRSTRRMRIENLKKASDFAKQCGIHAVHSHCGFIPEDPNEPLYKEAVAAIREVIGHCNENGQMFLYETGQETPITLLRAIQDVGLNNQGVNLDTANLILYGKGNPVDALDVIGKYVRGLHAKDGLFPTDPKNLGQEVPIGQGKVDFSKLIRRLRELGYQGPMTIEREISGPQQIEDVRQSITYLEKLLA